MSIHTIRSGGTAHPEVILLQLLSALLKAGGVKDLGDTDHLLVSENSGGADMDVEVQPGVAAVMKGLKAYPVYSDGAELVTITSNVSGQGRIDAIVLYIDLAASPNSDATNVAKLMAVAGTPAGSPAAPDDAAIQTAVGASNPFLRIANVTVDNGASSIVDAKIEDARTPIQLNGVSQTNWAFVTGTGVATAEKDIVFDTPFDEAPIMTVSVVGYNDVSDPTTRADATMTGGYAGYVGNVTPTGFRIGAISVNGVAPIENGVRRILLHWTATEKIG